MDSSILIGGLAIGAGLLYYSQASSAEINPSATAFNPNSVNEDGPDKRKQKLENVGNFLDDCATGGSSETGVCETALWDGGGETVVLTHPLAATNPIFKAYKFTLKLTTDLILSSTEAGFEQIPAGQVIGDYSWSISRSGAWYESSRWTKDQNSSNDFQNSLTKGNVMATVASVTPTWDEVLAAFGGYMSGRVAGLDKSISIVGGYFGDTGGSYRFVNSEGNTVSTMRINIGMDGAVITPSPIQMQTKCPSQSAWTPQGSPISLLNAVLGNNGAGSEFYPPQDITSGIPFCGSCPSFTGELPTSIRVVDWDDNMKQISIDDLLVSPTSVTFSKCSNGVSSSVYERLWGSTGFARVGKDNGGYFINYGSSKVYISTIIVGFDAMYQRRQVQCVCPGGSAKVGQSVTIYDTNNCPSWYNQANITEHCGGVSSGSGSGSGSGTGGTIGGLIGGNTGGYGGSSGNISMAESVTFINTGASYQVSW